MNKSDNKKRCVLCRKEVDILKLLVFNHFYFCKRCYENAELYNVLDEILDDLAEKRGQKLKRVDKKGA